MTSIFFIIQNPLTVLLWQEFFADRDVLNKMFVFKKESWHFFNNVCLPFKKNLYQPLIRPLLKSSFSTNFQGTGL